jgi:signal transduction histidine kinase
MLAHNAEFGMYAEDKNYLRNLLESAGAERDVAYAVALSQNMQPLVEKAFRKELSIPKELREKASRSLADPAEVQFIRGGIRYLEVLVPIRTQQDPDSLEMFPGRSAGLSRKLLGYIQLGLSFENQDKSLYSFLMSTLLFTSVSVLIGAFLTLLLTRRIARPLMAAVAHGVSEKNFDQRVKVRPGDEIGDLSEAFNRMLEQLQDYRAQVEAQKKTLEDLVEERTAELRQALQRAQHLTRKAEAANTAKSEFLANMSHELRTPLNHIIGFTELVADKQVGDLNEIQAEYLGDALGSSRHLLSLINDILDLSKVEAGKLQLEVTEVFLPALLQNSFTLVKEKAMKHGIQLQTEIDGIPERIRGDERKLKQILYNLLSNALKFTPEGGIVTLSACSLVSRDHQWTKGDGCAAPIPFVPNVSGEWVGISIRDTGIGVKAEDLERIFAPFEQADNSASRRFQGTGLGLSLTRQFVELHGGKIWAESEGEGKGSRFLFAIPCQPPVHPEDGQSPKEE